METEQVQVEGGTIEPQPNQEESLIQQNPLELQAQFFTLYFPKLVQMVDQLSKKQMKRVLLAAVEHPLNEQPFKFTTQVEKNCFTIAVQLAQANALMQMVTITTSDKFKTKPEEERAPIETVTENSDAPLSE